MKITIEKVENGYIVEYPLHKKSGGLIPSLTASMCNETQKAVFRKGVDMWAFVMPHLDKEAKS